MLLLTEDNNIKGKIKGGDKRQECSCLSFQNHNNMLVMVLERELCSRSSLQINSRRALNEEEEMAWKEIDYNLSKGATYPKAVLTITSFERRMKKGFNGVLSLQAVKLLKRPAHVKIFVDKKERLIGIKPAQEGFKISYSKQPQCLIPFTSVIKEFGEEICGAFTGELKNEMMVFNLRQPLPYRNRRPKKHYRRPKKH